MASKRTMMRLVRRSERAPAAPANKVLRAVRYSQTLMQDSARPMPRCARTRVNLVAHFPLPRELLLKLGL